MVCISYDRGELRTLLSRDDSYGNGKAQVYLYASEKLYHTCCAVLREGDLCIVLHREDRILHVLTSAGTGFIEVLDTKAVYGSYGKLYTYQG